MRTRARLTITLPKDILRRIDTLLNKGQANNRSHAIEQVLRAGLRPAVGTAVILAGGSPAKVAAPLKKIGNSYLFVEMLRHLQRFGIQQIVMCIPEDHETRYQQAFGTGSQLGTHITYVTETTPLGTAGALKQAQVAIGAEPFLVIHGDVLSNLSFTDLIDFHLAQGLPATIALKPRLSERKYGQVFIQGNRIVRFLKSGSDQGVSIINTGIYVLNPSIFNMIPSKGASYLERDVFPVLAERSKLAGFMFQGLWYDLSTNEAVAEAVLRWRNMVH